MYNHKESVEDYLERILILTNEMKVIRSIDLARSMEFSKASISIAVKKLKELKYLNINEETGELTLTESGKEIAKSTLEKHNILTKSFESLGVSKETAEKDACKIEHLLSDETFDALRKHYNNR